VSFTEDNEMRWQASDHAEHAIRGLMRSVRLLHDAALCADDPELINATARGFTEYLGSVLWERRHRPEHGGRMREKLDGAARTERLNIRDEVHALLHSATLTPAACSFVAAALGSIMYAEYDGTMPSHQDVADLDTFYKIWQRLGDRAVEIDSFSIVHYLSNAVISASGIDDEAAFYDAAEAVQCMAGSTSFTAEQMTGRSASLLADLSGALLYYQLTHPRAAYPEPSSWQFLINVAWFQPMLDGLLWPKCAELAAWAAGMLNATGSTESAIAWGWLAAKLSDHPDGNPPGVVWEQIGNSFLQILLDPNMPAVQASELLGLLGERVDAAGHDALARFGYGLTNIAFSLPRSDAMAPQVAAFMLRAVESGISASEDVTARIYALTSLLVDRAFHGRWDFVDQAIENYTAPDASTGWAGLVAAHRAIAELVLMPDVGAPRLAKVVSILQRPFAELDNAGPVEASRRTAIERILSRPEQDVHPLAFFPLLGVSTDE
jgi:hypothetical protein